VPNWPLPPTSEAATIKLQPDVHAAGTLQGRSKEAPHAAQKVARAPHQWEDPPQCFIEQGPHKQGIHRPGTAPGLSPTHAGRCRATMGSVDLTAASSSYPLQLSDTRPTNTPARQRQSPTPWLRAAEPSRCPAEQDRTGSCAATSTAAHLPLQFLSQVPRSPCACSRYIR